MLKNIENIGKVIFLKEESLLSESLVRYSIDFMAIIVVPVLLLMNISKDSTVLPIYLLSLIPILIFSRIFFKETINGYEIFAKKNDLKYSSSGSVDTIYSPLGVETSNIITFKLFDHKSYILNQTVPVINDSYHTITILKVELDCDSPTFMFVPRLMIRGDMDSLQGMKKPRFLPMNGEMGKKYILTVENDFPYKSLGMFSPSFMKVYNDRFDGLRLWMGGDKAYVIFDDVVYDSKIFKAMLELGEYVVKELEMVMGGKKKKATKKTTAKTVKKEKKTKLDK
ncbi:MAG: hypothetical protein PHW52_01835 [Candidatus Pacebacteria bacterium]|nr:hypothetical protein [Candidatus Paceibacterota bacterium]